MTVTMGALLTDVGSVAGTTMTTIGTVANTVATYPILIIPIGMFVLGAAAALLKRFFV